MLRLNNVVFIKNGRISINMYSKRSIIYLIATSLPALLLLAPVCLHLAPFYLHIVPCIVIIACLIATIVLTCLTIFTEPGYLPNSALQTSFV